MPSERSEPYPKGATNPNPKRSGIMDRTIPYDENAICDICGKQGAYDLMGDLVCEECLKKLNRVRCGSHP